MYEKCTYLNWYEGGFLKHTLTHRNGFSTCGAGCSAQPTVCRTRDFLLRSGRLCVIIWKQNENGLFVCSHPRHWSENGWKNWKQINLFLQYLSPLDSRFIPFPELYTRPPPHPHTHPHTHARHLRCN